VVEPLRVKKQVIRSAVEAVTMLLRVDDVIASKGGGSGGGPPGGMPRAWVAVWRHATRHDGRNVAETILN